jgi:hypothetical protein
MKSFLISIIAMMMVGLWARAYSQQPEEIVPSGYNYVDQTDTLKSAYRLMASCGLGFSYCWDHYYMYAPTLCIGLEFPFSVGHHFAFQLNTHTWIDEINSNPMPQSYPIDDVFINISGNYYSQIGLSGLIKAYIGSVNSDFRFSFIAGALFLSPAKEYWGLDLGFAIFYSIEDKLKLSLENRHIFKCINIENCNLTTPMITSLNMNYYFIW